MKLYLQWTLATPTDWVEIDVRPTGPFRRAWENLPTKPVPVGGEVIDNVPGWLMALNIQGVEFSGFDHLAVEPVTGGIRISGWNDDPADWPPGKRQARVWTFFDPAPDARLGGQVNTQQLLTVYDEDAAEIDRWSRAETSGGAVVVRPWADFVPPSAGVTRHGIWTNDALFAVHSNARSSHNWREWVVT